MDQDKMGLRAAGRRVRHSGQIYSLKTGRGERLVWFEGGRCAMERAGKVPAMSGQHSRYRGTQLGCRPASLATKRFRQPQ